MKKTALLVDVTSIQKYIFGSNKLKENIGASYIIETLIFGSLLKDITENECSNTDNWGKKLNFVHNGNTIYFEVIYIGGGNGLFVFNTMEQLRTFSTLFYEKCLLHFPGLNLATTSLPYPENKIEFPAFRKEIARKLAFDKSIKPTSSNFFKSGIFNDCPNSHNYAEFPINNENGLFSGEVLAKFNACTLAENEINNSYQLSNFVFTSNIEDLGQDPDKGYVAVVHIDGNNIGKKFISCKNVEDLRTLSKAVATIGQNSMHELCKYLDNQKSKLKQAINLKNNETGSTILPLRPILTGGDDITFVCEGKIGIHLAEKFIDFFENQARIAFNKIEGYDGEDIRACAGIAIVKSKFPFFKAYQLATELCDEAKTFSRDNNHSWLSFHISKTGVSGNLDQIRKSELASPNGSLNGNPYCLDSNGENRRSINNLHQILNEFTDPDSWPRSKVMELRESLLGSKANEKLFLINNSHRNRTLPNCEKHIWRDDKLPQPRPYTIYSDAIEALAFYPPEFLTQKIQVNAS